MAQAATKHERELEWHELSRHEGGGVIWGISIASSAAKTVERAWAITCTEPEQRFESDVYEIIEGADLHLPTDRLSIDPLLRDQYLVQAAMVRARLTELQRSPADMEAIAGSLRNQALEVARAWDSEEQERIRNNTSDAQAIAVARQWVRGLVLLREKGTDEEKTVLAQLLREK
jgi:hypothetical protein